MTIGRIPSIEGGIQPTIFDAKGDLLTATADDTPARIPIGANNTVLTADSAQALGLKWAAQTSSSGLTLISTTTMSNVSSQEVAGCFTSTYSNYLIVLSNLYASVDNTIPKIQYMYSTNTVETAGYYGGFCGFNYSGVAGTDNVANTYSQTAITLPALSNTIPTGATMTFFEPNVGTNKCAANVDWKSGYFGWRYVGAMAQNTSRVYTGFKLTTAANNLYGTISIYGLAK